MQISYKTTYIGYRSELIVVQQHHNLTLLRLLLDLGLDLLLLGVGGEVHGAGEGSVGHAPRVRFPQHRLRHPRQPVHAWVSITYSALYLVTQLSSPQVGDTEVVVPIVPGPGAQQVVMADLSRK